MYILKCGITFQVFGWGDNSSGQLGLHDMKYQQPQKISVSIVTQILCRSFPYRTFH